MVLGLLSRERKKAFTLIELLLSVIITGMAISAVAFSFSNYLKDQKTREVTIGSDSYSVAPAWNELKSAMDLQLDFREDLLNASAIFVLGGEYEAGSGIQASPSTNVDVDSIAGVSSVSSLSSVSGSLVNSATKFRGKLAGTYSFITSDPQDFTVFLLGHPSQESKTTLLGVATVRSQISDDYRVYTVGYYRNTSGSAMVLSGSYSFAIEVTEQQAFAFKVGAVHTWGHEYANWGISEEMGCKVVFPDPTAMPRKASTTVSTFSRFMYFLPVKQ